MQKTRTLLLCLLLFMTLGSASAQQQDSLRVLWIGNSFTFVNDLPAMVQRIASSKGITLSNTRSLKGGQCLEGHLRDQVLARRLDQGGWDYVIIQEQSARPALPTQRVAREVYPFAAQLVQNIRKHSPHAHIIFYMTWGHKYGNLEQVENYPLDDTYQGMQERLKTSYLEMTYANNAWCAPVGMAWQTVRAERPQCVLYKHDLSHPSVRGTYLAANVIFTTLYQQPYQTDYTAALDGEEAEYLQQTAQQTVLNQLELLNIRPARQAE